MAERPYESARERIIDAAERVIVREGLGKLSVDAVLREAEVSKGGFFHHFATKDELLAALMARLSSHVAEQARGIASRDREPRGSALRAQISLAFQTPKRERDRLQALVLARIEASKSNPTVAAQARANNERSIAEGAAEGISPGRVLLIQLALDGYWLGESLGTLSLSPAQRDALESELLALALPGGPARPASPEPRSVARSAAPAAKPPERAARAKPKP
jgi:AcrR family transcriptional regulator